MEMQAVAKAGFLRQAFAAFVALAFRKFTGSVNDAIKIAPEGAMEWLPHSPTWRKLK